jgi:hypothetical protein
MGTALWLAAALAAAGAAPAPGDEGDAFPAERRGESVASLTVRVAEKGAAPGLAAVRLTVSVTGPAGAEVEPLRLEDPTDSWKVPLAAGSWGVDGGRLTWCQTAELRQARPGVVALPGVRLRLRDGPGAEWQEVVWADILKTLRGPPPAEELPPPAPSPWPGRLRRAGAAVGAALVLGLALALWVALRRRGRRAEPLPPHDRALRELERVEREGLPPAGDAAEYHTRVGDVVRAYVAARFGVRAAQQTTAEFLAGLGAVPELDAEGRELLRSFLERCDLAKFARVSPPPEECRRTAELAREFVRRTAATAGDGKVAGAGQGASGPAR